MTDYYIIYINNFIIYYRICIIHIYIYIYMDVCVDYDARGARHRLGMIKLTMVTIITNLVLQKCENWKAKVKHLPPKWTNKGQHELKYWHKHHRGILTCSTEGARMNDNAFFQKPCIWPHLFLCTFLGSSGSPAASVTFCWQCGTCVKSQSDRFSSTLR